jgi:hypothetical protein
MSNQKKMSLLIAAGLAVSLSAFPVFADDAPAPPPGDGPAHHERGPRQSMFDRLETQLKLTDDQKATVHPIFVDAQAQLDAIRKDKDLSMEDKKAKRLEVIEALPDKVNPSLNDDQKAILAKFVERMKNPPQRGDHGPRGQHGDHPKPPQGGDQPHQDMPDQDG